MFREYLSYVIYHRCFYNCDTSGKFNVQLASKFLISYLELKWLQICLIYLIMLESPSKAIFPNINLQSGWLYTYPCSYFKMLKIIQLEF